MLNTTPKNDHYMGLILWECLFTIGFNPSSGNNKNKAARSAALFIAKGGMS